MAVVTSKRIYKLFYKGYEMKLFFSFLFKICVSFKWQFQKKERIHFYRPDEENNIAEYCIGLNTIALEKYYKYFCSRDVSNIGTILGISISRAFSPMCSRQLWDGWTHPFIGPATSSGLQDSEMCGGILQTPPSTG